LDLLGVSGEPSLLLLDQSHLLTETGHLFSDGILKLPPLSVVELRLKVEGRL